MVSPPHHLRHHSDHILTSRWSTRIVVDIGYGIDIDDGDSYVTLAEEVSRYFALGVEPFSWLVDIFPFRAQFRLLIIW